MNLSCWCKHLPCVYLLISGLLLCSFASGDEPTPEPAEGDVTTTTDKSSTTPATGVPGERKTNGSAPGEIRKTSARGSRALFHSSGDTWRSVAVILRRGLRMFRESLREGAKVAHMFKEDLDEGMTSIMRQNRGVKPEGQGTNDDSFGSGSFFDSQMLREGVLGGILRFMGVNSKQMGVIALNVLIILAEWITSSMIGNPEVAGVTSRMIKSNLLEWASTGYNPKLEKLLHQAKSHSLPEKLIDTLSENTGNTTSCVQLLICKMSPVIWGVQDTVKDEFGPSEHEPKVQTAAPPASNLTLERDQGSEPRGILELSQTLVDKVLGRLPPKERMLDFGDRCEKKFPHCQLLNFNSVSVL